MKTVSWTSLFIAVAAFPIVVFAQGWRPITPESAAIDMETLRAIAGRDAPHCAAVKVSAPVSFHGRTLIEIPDITEPDLRLANQLMSAGCFAGAVARLDALMRTDPGNRNAKYVVARMTWMRMGMQEAEPVVTKLLAEHKDFVSAKVLLAGIRYSQQNYPEAARLLDETEPVSPKDLWIFMNRLRIEALRAPSPNLRARLLEIALSPAFPPNARETAANVAKDIPGQTEQQIEEVFRAKLDIDSNVDVPCKAAEYAFWLGAIRDRYADVITLLESPRAKEGHCMGLERNRTMLAHAYLMEAAKISARPSPANQRQRDRAKEIVDGDYKNVAEFAERLSQTELLAPFIAPQPPLKLQGT